MADTQHHYVYDVDTPPDLPPEQLTRLIGGKAAGLVMMATELQLPVPPAFVITTEACIAALGGRWPATLDEEVEHHVERLGAVVGLRFGDDRDPLLVSVRSGAPVSMPGMMDTILNLGLTDATADGLARATGDARFAADCLDRFRRAYREVIGVDRVPDDPWLQLREATEAIFRSWDGDRARAYRRLEGISDDLGTAVTVQAMVFGNRSPSSGTGVLFTRNPATGERAPYGDVMFDAQGEDVVAGGLEPQPMAALEERLPAVAAELRRHADRLEHRLGDLCDIEFTIERGRLWLLQVRVGKRSPRAALRMAIDMAEDESFPLTRGAAVRRVAELLADPPREFVRGPDAPAPIAVGLPASPGVARGGIVTSSEAAERAAASGDAVILVRTETSPEDVRGMARAAGVLTSRGGLASHAAVVARGWGIPAVVGAADVRPLDGRVEIGDQGFNAGEEISIDGDSGEVFDGALPGSWSVLPEAETLRAWAAELGIDLEPASASAGDTGGTAAITEPSLPPPSASDILRAITIRGAGSVDQLAQCVVAEPSAIEAAASELVAAGLAERVGDELRATAEGRVDAKAAFAADRARIGERRTGELLEAFRPLDAQVKEVVSAWQLREVDGAQVANDHQDPGYDGVVLDRLASLQAEADGWIGPVADDLRAYAAYAARLERATARARGGDHRFVASPRVDSYHGVWFELHEDLIRLAGRRREDETSA